MVRFGVQRAQGYVERVLNAFGPEPDRDKRLLIVDSVSVHVTWLIRSTPHFSDFPSHLCSSPRSSPPPAHHLISARRTTCSSQPPTRADLTSRQSVLVGIVVVPRYPLIKLFAVVAPSSPHSFLTTPNSSRLDSSSVSLGWDRCCTPLPPHISKNRFSDVGKYRLYSRICEKAALPLYSALLHPPDNI